MAHAKKAKPKKVQLRSGRLNPAKLFSQGIGSLVPFLKGIKKKPVKKKKK